MPVFTGDVYLDKPYKFHLEDETEFVINLEYPISKTGIPSIGKVNLRQDKSYLLETFGSRIVGVNLANNHIMDFGVEALNNTLSTLEELNLPYFGAGSEEDNFHNPLIIIRSKIKYALFGYCCSSTNAILSDEKSIGACPLHKTNVINDIKEYKAKGHFVVLNIHWGQEEIHIPKPEDVNMAREFIDNGADLIVGHHAHVIQSFEEYNSKHIFYGLGNFIFPDLNMPSMYDGTKYTSRYVKKQYSWNKESLLIKINNDKVETQKATLKGKKIVISNQDIKSYPITLNNEKWKREVVKSRSRRKFQKLVEKPFYNIGKKVKIDK